MVHKPLPNLCYEQRLWSDGYQCVAGLDEAGRGAWAGPVVAAAVVLPPGEPNLLSQLDGVSDSKKLSPARREALLEIVREYALALAIGAVPPAEIDRVGIVPATRRAMALALEALALETLVPGSHVPGSSVSGSSVSGPLPVKVDHLLIDHLRLPDLPLPQISLPKGDARVLSIAAASIVAKVSRDRMMVGLDAEYPGYGFARHKGYGTPQHQAALASLGPSFTHRLSFAPLQRLQDRSEQQAPTTSQQDAGSRIPACPEQAKDFESRNSIPESRAHHDP